MNKFPLESFAFLNGQPNVTATLRQYPEDFIVQEDLGYEPEGDGEHHYLFIRKIGENTDWVARQLANFCQVSPRDVAYAGKKDRHAMTQQWFSVHLPKSRRTINWALFGGDTIKVLRSEKGRRKIKLGNLKGNRFDITLRNVSNMDALLERVELLKNGVPNYFGEQRFGQEFGNLFYGAAMLAGEHEERARHKRGLYISAIRSYLFNCTLSDRINQHRWSLPELGDVLIEDYTQRCQIFEQDNVEQLARFNALDLHLSAPMWGQSELYSKFAVAEHEQAVADRYPELSKGLEQLGLRQERRGVRLVPRDLEVTVRAEGECTLGFSLPSGSFATSILRELCVWDGAQTLYE